MEISCPFDVRFVFVLKFTDLEKLEIFPGPHQGDALIRPKPMNDLLHLSIEELQDQLWGLSLHAHKLEDKVVQQSQTLAEKEAEINNLHVETQSLRATLEASEPEVTADPSADADRKRLERLCKRRANGTLVVPEHIHEKWKQGGQGRQELRKLLMEANYDKDEFIKMVEIEREKTKQLDLKTEGDFLSEAAMRKEGISERLDNLVIVIERLYN